MEEQFEDWWVMVKEGSPEDGTLDNELKVTFYSGAFSLLTEFSTAAELDAEARASFDTLFNEMSEYFEKVIAQSTAANTTAPLH